MLALAVPCAYSAAVLGVHLHAMSMPMLCYANAILQWFNAAAADDEQLLLLL